MSDHRIVEWQDLRPPGFASDESDLSLLEVDVLHAKAKKIGHAGTEVVEQHHDGQPISTRHQCGGRAAHVAARLIESIDRFNRCNPWKIPVLTKCFHVGHSGDHA